MADDLTEKVALRTRAAQRVRDTGASNVAGIIEETLAVVADDVDGIAGVLALHQRHGAGMTYNSPDTCSCGARTLPERGDEDPRQRRDRAFAQHQAAMVAAHIRGGV